MLILLLASCGKDDDASSNNGDSNNLSMKINGVLWTSTNITSLIDTDTENAVLNSVNTTEGESFGFNIEDFTGIGDYPTAKGSGTTGAFYARKDKKLFSASSEIKYKVTNVDGTKFHGTFSGSLKSTDGIVLTVTEGKF